MKNKIVVVGAGITGITLAERFASLGCRVLIIEKRDHVGGNCYDFKNENEIFVQRYGPHIFHTDYKEVWDYLSQFTDWMYYQHKVLGFIDGECVPIPFNLNTLYKLLPIKLAERLEEKLVNTFGYGEKIPILRLKETEDTDLKFLADFIYDKVFLHYTKKQWGLKPEELDFSVTSRVPVVISRDDRYFHDTYQGIPEMGYTKMFERMLQNENIEVMLDTDYRDIEKEVESDLMCYTGPVDEFFNYKFGKLDYRHLKIDFKTFNQESYQPSAVVNYPNNYSFTRITEFRKFTQQRTRGTTIGIEFTGTNGFMAWPVLNKKNKRIIEKYLGEVKNLKRNIYFIGRLAEYRYYDMDDAIKNALDLFNNLKLRN